MRFSIIAATSLCLCYNAMAMPLSDETLPLLSDAPLANASETLDKRLTIEEWVALLSIGNMAAFVGLGFANLMAAKIKSLSDTNSCGIVTGNIDGINYQYHASTTGSKCDTTAQEKTIRDAINRGLDFMVKHNVNQACFNMQHGGTWKGLLQLASSDKTIINNRCDDVAYTIIV